MKSLIQEDLSRGDQLANWLADDLCGFFFFSFFFSFFLSDICIHSERTFSGKYTTPDRFQKEIRIYKGKTKEGEKKKKKKYRV